MGAVADGGGGRRSDFTPEGTRNALRGQIDTASLKMIEFDGGGNVVVYPNSGGNDSGGREIGRGTGICSARVPVTLNGMELLKNGYPS